MLVAADLTPRCLGAYIPTLSNSSSTNVLKRSLFSGLVSGLDAFSPYPLVRGCSAVPCRTTDRLEAPLPCSSRTKSNLPSDFKTPLIDSNRPVSRRSKPSSRSPLIGEQPHPWLLLHSQDGKNRHRGSKPPGRYVLLPVTTLLSPG